MLSGIVGKAQEVPDISGLWKRNDGLMFKFSQNDKKVTVILDVSTLHHVVTMTYKGNDIFKGTMDRRNTSNGCTTYLSWKVELVSDTQMRLSEGALDSNCDVPISYKADFVLTKQD